MERDSNSCVMQAMVSHRLTQRNKPPGAPAAVIKPFTLHPDTALWHVPMTSSDAPELKDGITCQCLPRSGLAVCSFVC